LLVLKGAYYIMLVLKGAYYILLADVVIDDLFKDDFVPSRF